MTYDHLSREDLAALVPELLLSGHLIDRSGMAHAIGAFGREGMGQVAIEEWMGASPVYTARMRSALGITTNTVADMFKCFQHDIGAPPQFLDFRFSVTDDNTDGRGTYTQVHSDFTGFSTNGVLNAWVRNALIGSGTSTVFTANQAGSTGGGLLIYRVTGMSIVGLGAIRGAGGQSSGTAATAPAPVLLRRVGTTFSGTQAALTGNAMVGCVCNGTNSTTTTAQPTGWTESFDNGYNTPATGMEVCFRNSGETNSTITWTANSASAFASLAIELDASVPQYDWVVTGKADRDREIWLQGAVGRSSVW